MEDKSYTEKKIKFEDDKLIYKPCIALRFCEKMKYPPKMST